MCICFRALVFEHLDSLHILGFEGWVRSKDFVKEKVERKFLVKIAELNGHLGILMWIQWPSKDEL